MWEEMILDLKVQVAKLTTSLKYWKRKGKSMSSGVGSPLEEDHEALQIYIELGDVIAKNFANPESMAMVKAFDMYRRNLRVRLGDF